MPTLGCSTLTSILKSCDNNMGGIRQIWLWDMEDIDPTVNVFNAATGIWTAYTIGIAAPLPPTTYEFTRNSSNYMEEGTIDLVAGSSYIKATITLNFARREAAKSVSLKLMGDGQRYLGALVLDSNGLYWLFEDLQLSATGEGSGTARADGSKYSVTFIGETANYAGEVLGANNTPPSTDADDLITTGTF